MGMRVENLNQENMDILEKQVRELEDISPEITHKKFLMDDLNNSRKIDELKSEIKNVKDTLENFKKAFDLIFGGHILVDGKWIRVDLKKV